MEIGGAVPGKETESGFQNPDGFVTIDVESLSHVIPSSSPRITRNVSRKGSPRSNNERKLLQCNTNVNDKETSFPQSPLRGSSTPEKPNTMGSIDHAGTTITAATGAVSASSVHQITITTAATTDQNRERRLGFVRKSSFKRTHTSWMLDPKKIVIFFATLSSIGSILLIIFTLSINKSNSGDMPLD